MNPVIQIKNIKKSFESVHALRGVSLEILEGEFFGLLGPNGAGKTTLINALVGLVKPDEGSALIFGHDIQKEPLKAKKFFGLSPQEINIHYFMPIGKILEFQGGFYGLSRKEAKKRTEELLHQFGLWEKRKKGRFALSGGMQKRLLIARALMGYPKFLILDEPTAGLDIELRHDLWHYLEMLKNQFKVTIFLTTHYIEEAERLADRVAIIDQGKIVVCDSPKNLIATRGFSEAEKKNMPRYIRPHTLEEVYVHLTGKRFLGKDHAE